MWHAATDRAREVQTITPPTRCIDANSTSSLDRARGTHAITAPGDAVLVLHADTALPALWDALLLRSLSDRAVLMTAFSFQCDRAQLAEAHSPPAGLALMEWTVNLRSRWYELPFGDQALATTRATLDALGGYPPTCDYPRDYPRLPEIARAG